MSEIELRDFKAPPLEVGRSPAVASLPSSSRSDSKSTATWNVEKEVNGYFCAHTIEEIKKIEQNTRLLVEQKKEDLRQMVGERYRELVDAADSVVEMKTHSEQVLHSVSRLHQLCEQLHQSHYLRGSGGMKGPASDYLSQHHAVAVQLRLLCDIPGKIWNSLEQGAYLQAANSYLLAQQVYMHLKLDRGPQTSLLVQGLWEHTLALKPTIVESCQQLLQSVGIGEEVAIQSLCSVALLEGSSPRQLFTQFLVARKAALQSVFNPTKQAHLSAKAVVCEAINSVRRSLLLVATIFCCRAGDGSQVPSKLCGALHNAGNDKNKAVQQLLGRSLEATQGLKVADVPESVIHSSCEQWITMTLSDIEEGVGSCLAHVTTVKAISAIRRSVHDLLTEPMTGTALDQRLTDSASQWKWACDCVLGRPLSLHGQFLQRIEFSRIKSILTRLFGEVVAHAHSLLDSLLGGFVKDAPLYALDCRVSAYLWQEEEGGLQKKGCDHGGMAKVLRLKAKGCTPNVYSFCEGFDEKLKVVIQEVSHFIFMPSADKCGSKREVDLYPFSLSVDSLEVQSLLQHLAGDCIERFVQDIKGRLLLLQEEPAMQLLVINKVLLLARVCNCLSEFCPSLVMLLNGLRKLDPPRGVADGRLSRSRLQASQKEAAAETPALSMLQQQALTIFRIWADWCSGEFSQVLHKHVFGNTGTTTNSLASVLAWEDITIVEEAESGQQLSSTIRVPCQPSVYVTSLLYSVCKEISRVGSSTVDRSILEYLSSSLFGVVVTVHEQLLAEVTQNKLVVPQDCALQLLFNVRFLSRVLVEAAVMGERFKAICSQLQAFVDPFDLDVFMPHMSSNLERHVQRSIVLLGLLVVVKGPQTILTHQPLTSRGVQEKPSIVPMGQQAPRILSLPISTAQSLIQQSHQDVRVETEQSLAGTFAFFHL
ncbi:hypothetical protein EMCRGX_G022267 [Ephydatia muelleri]|eukprot:Em0009g1023a